MVKLQHSQGSPRGQRQACNYKFSSFSYPTRSLIAHVFAFSNRLGPNARHMPFNTNIITEWILHRQLNDSITAKWSFPCTEQRTKKTASLLFSFTIFLPALPLFFLVSRMFGEMTEDEEEEEVKSAFQEQFTCRWARRGNCESGATIWSNNKVVHCQQILLRCEIIFSPLNERREIDEGEFSFLHTYMQARFLCSAFSLIFSQCSGTLTSLSRFTPKHKSSPNFNGKHLVPLRNSLCFWFIRENTFLCAVIVYVSNSFFFTFGRYYSESCAWENYNATTVKSMAVEIDGK